MGSVSEGGCFFTRIGKALFSSGVRPETAQNRTNGLSVAELNSRIAGLEMDVGERDKKIERMAHEFSLLRSQTQKDTKEIKSEALDKLCKKIAPFLSQLATMRSMYETGKEVKPKDLLILLGKMEKVFEADGLKPVGATGQRVAFNGRHHQRMSGDSVNDGEEVVVRFVGYSLNGEILIKAMVSRKES
mgnify:FL=1